MWLALEMAGRAAQIVGEVHACVKEYPIRVMVKTHGGGALRMMAG